MKELSFDSTHSVTVQDEKDFKYFRKEQKEDGVISQIGIKEDGSEEVQKYFFDSSIFDSDKTEAWLKDNQVQASITNNKSLKIDRSGKQEERKRNIAEIYLRF